MTADGTVMSVQVRMPAALAETLSGRAAGNHRSRNAEILSILDQAIRADAATAVVRQRLSGATHEFKPQSANARCGECGMLRHQHVEV